ncbi:MAG: hypothetical protein WC044_09300 [Crocinitomicaceae bacterium]
MKKLLILTLAFYGLCAFSSVSVWKEEAARPNSILQTKSIRFTLANSSAKSIPLIIPGVMNPNLSPFSRSGVELSVGQMIFFKTKGKKQLLLKVDESIENGAVLDVAELLKKRKKELRIAE